MAAERRQAGSEAAAFEESGARGGERARRLAIEGLFARLLPWLARWAHRRLPTHARRRCDTWDLVQDACSGALTHLDDLDEKDPVLVRAYLQRSIRNRIRDEIRRARIGETASAEGMSPADHRASPLDDTLESDERRRYRAALLALDADDRQLVVGRVELQISYQELARATGRPSADAARGAARRAVLRLARELGRLERRERAALDPRHSP